MHAFNHINNQKFAEQNVKPNKIERKKKKKERKKNQCIL